MPDNRVIVITGATRGLGAALTEEFIRRRHTVVGCGRTVDRIEAFQEEYGPPHRFAAVDVRDSDSVESWARECLAAGLVPDLLINNAAIANQPAALWKVPKDEFDAVIDINIKGVVNVIRAFLPAMLDRQKGIVVNMSSGWGRSVSPEVAPYCTTKWAIEGLSKAMAEELPAGMAVVPLNPGIIDTDMLRICFGAEAGAFHTPDQWVESAADMILGLSERDNGASLSVR